MQAGKLDRRVRFDAATETLSAAGEPTRTWAEVATVWGSKEPLTGREAFQAQQLQAKVDTRFRIRWNETLSHVTPKETFRILCDGLVYDIVSALEVGRREGLEFMAFARAD